MASIAYEATKKKSHRVVIICVIVFDFDFRLQLFLEVDSRVEDTVKHLLLVGVLRFGLKYSIPFGFPFIFIFDKLL